MGERRIFALLPFMWGDWVTHLNCSSVRTVAQPPLEAAASECPFIGMRFENATVEN